MLLCIAATNDCAEQIDFLAGGIAHAGIFYWKFDREPVGKNELVFTGHPSLRHQRYRDAYGDYPTGLRPGETELMYAYQYRMGVGPAIVWPAEMRHSRVYGGGGVLEKLLKDAGYRPGSLDGAKIRAHATAILGLA